VVVIRSYVLRRPSDFAALERLPLQDDERPLEPHHEAR
jgi:hypothetical protein